MKIRMLVQYAGEGFYHEPGEVIERPDEVGQRLVSRGHAIALQPLRETAVAERISETRAPKTKAGRKRA